MDASKTEEDKHETIDFEKSKNKIIFKDFSNANLLNQTNDMSLINPEYMAQQNEMYK